MRAETLINKIKNNKYARIETSKNCVVDEILDCYYMDEDQEHIEISRFNTKIVKYYDLISENEIQETVTIYPYGIQVIQFTTTFENIEDENLVWY